MTRSTKTQKLVLALSFTAMGLGLVHCNSDFNPASESQSEARVKAAVAGSWTCQGTQADGCDSNEQIQFAADMTTMTKSFQRSSPGNYACDLEQASKVALIKGKHHHHKNGGAKTEKVFEAEVTPGPITLAQAPDAASDCQSYVDSLNQAQGASPAAQLTKIEIDQKKEELSISAVEAQTTTMPKLYQKTAVAAASPAPSPSGRQ